MLVFQLMCNINLLLSGLGWLNKLSYDWVIKTTGEVSANLIYLATVPNSEL